MTHTFQLDPAADDQKLLAQILDYYHTTLKSSDEGLAYLKTRGITDTAAVDTFRIGYADRSLGLQLPRKEVKAGGALRSRLVQVGLYRESGHEHFRGSITIPVFAGDGTGRIVDVYGRKTGNHLRAGTALDTYLGKERRGVWNIEGLAGAKEVIICASVFDALLFWVHGHRNVTCTLGPDALTDDHFTALAEFKIQRVLLANSALAPKLLEAGIDCDKLALPLHLDAQGHDIAEKLNTALRKAEWLGKGKSSTPPPSEPGPTPTPAPSPPPMPAPESLLPADVMTEVSDDEVQISFGDRHYRVRGWARNLSFDQLRVNVMARNDTGHFVDVFDLYSAKHRKGFVMQAALELGVDEQTIKRDVGRVLLKLEELQDQSIAKTLAPKETKPLMTDREREEALQLLRDPNLLERIVEHFDIVGERTNKLVGFLASISRKLDDPLAVVVQSTSAAGKTALMDAVLSLVPPEDLLKFSAMTGASLYYLGENDLQHRVLAIVEEEGAERASYALKLLQSEGELSIASTGKDTTTGRLVTKEYRVRGPVMIFLTTTSVKIDEELLNRCMVLTVNENREQTRAIHQVQRLRQTLAGMLARRDRDQVLTIERNAQRLLRPLLVVNPFAETLTFIDDKTRTRRDHAKYLTLMRTVALLHQYQRPIKTVDHRGQSIEYVEITLDDIAVTNHLAREVLGRSLDDLPPQTRRLLDLLDGMVTADCKKKAIDRSDYRFSRRDLREHTGWGHTQLKIHLQRLAELEYVLVHRGPHGKSFVYELLYEKPPDGQHFLPGLIDVEEVRRQRSAQEKALVG